MSLKKSINKLSENRFLFEELVKRDFKEKYKRTTLGILWSLLSPLLTLLVMKVIFTGFFGRNTPHYTTYMFSGILIMSYYKESTKGGMNCLVANSAVFTKINIPKYLFLLSKNVSALCNFCLSLIVYFAFCIGDHITFSKSMLMMPFPILCLLVMNIGIGMILSAAYVFFRDTKYLYDVFLTLLHYVSAIFYTTSSFGNKQKYFLINPVFVIIKYMRTIVIDGTLPSLQYHLLCMFYALFFLLIGCLVYKKYNHQFLYYV